MIASNLARDERSSHFKPLGWQARAQERISNPTDCTAGVDAALTEAWGAFSRVATPTIKELTLLGSLARHAKGALLQREGDADEAVFVVVTGKLRAFSAGNDHREVTYATCSQGDLVGEVISDGGALDANVVVEEQALCAVVSRATLNAYLAEHPHAAYELLARSHTALRHARKRIKDFALHDAYTRLAAFLRSNAQPTPTGMAVVARFTHQSLASLLDCSREMVSRLLKDLERGGYLQTDGCHWVLGRPLPARW